MEHPSPTIQGDELKTGNAAVFFRGDYQRIFRYIVSMVQDSKEAEDLTQETFLRAYRRRDSLRDEGAQTAWLYRIATHVSLDRLRQYARRGPMESETEAQVENIRARIAGYAYIARFESVLETIERQDYRLAPEYPQGRGLGAGMKMGGLVLSLAIFPPVRK